MRPFFLAVAMLVAPVALATAQTITTRDIVELSKAGLDEEVLLALIEVHRPVFPVDTETLKRLKDAGVAPNVIIAMIRSGREAPPPPVPELVAEHTPTAPAPQPQVVVVERERYYDEPRVREVAVPVPIYVPVHTRTRHDSVRPRPDPKPAEPVYWGFGGKLRPDGWKPTAADVQKDAKVPREPQKK
ncbi:MAG: hypothetical protein WD227_02975 [Vicinamibacterales bacterium]